MTNDVVCEQTVGYYHLGDYVNVLREGSLVANADLSGFMRPPVLFGTVSGLIGMILSLTREKFEFLDKLQSIMRKVSTGAHLGSFFEGEAL